MKMLCGTLGHLLVFSGLVLEVIDGLPEESDAEQAAVVVLKQQAVHGDIMGKESNTTMSSWGTPIG